MVVVVTGWLTEGAAEEGGWDEIMVGVEQTRATSENGALVVPSGGTGGRLLPNIGFMISERLGGWSSVSGRVEFRSESDAFFDSKNVALWSRKFAAKRRQLPIMQADASAGVLDIEGGQVWSIWRDCGGWPIELSPAFELGFKGQKKSKLRPYFSVRLNIPMMYHHSKMPL